MLVGKIKKNTSSEIWVLLRDYRNEQWLDIREHFYSPDSAKWLPTKKGIMLRPELIAPVIEGLEKLSAMVDLGLAAIIDKTESTEIQIGYREYQGHKFGEIRMYLKGEQKQDAVPTPKGVTFRLNLTDSLLDSMNDASENLSNH